MRRFVEGVDRSQTTPFPERLEDWVDENIPVRVIDAFVDALDLRGLGSWPVISNSSIRPTGMNQQRRWLAGPPG
jgi:transposase